MGFTWFDFAALIVLGLSGVMAFARGLIREVFSIIAFIGGAIAAVFFAGIGRPLVEQFSPLSGPLASVAAGLVIFLIVFITITVITSIVAKEAHQSTEISSFDRAAGLAFGILRGVLVVSLFVLLMRQTTPTDATQPADPMQDAIRGARTFPIYDGVAKALEAVLPQARDRARDIIDRQKGESAPNSTRVQRSSYHHAPGHDALKAEVQMTAERHLLHFETAPGDPVVDRWELDDKPREECGVFGVFGSEDASVLTALGLHGLQHRGQEGCGIVSFDGARFHHERHLGLVGEHFSGADVPRRLPGTQAIGHTRYATQGGTLLRNVQPLFADLSFGGFAIAHNGNLTNSRDLRDRLVEDGAIFQSTSDTECIVQLIARSRRAKIVDRFVEAIHQIQGAYALVCLSKDMMIGARDPIGIRPLVLGDRNGVPILASETCALDMIGAKFVRTIKPGEVIVATKVRGETKIESHFPFGERQARPCIFEYVYFARPDSVMDGRSVYDIRKRMGMRLAQETGVEADVIVPVPNSGVPAAMGFAAHSGVPYELGIIRNHYVGRTFIQPKQEIRALGVRLKHAANTGVLKGKRVVLVDNSIVRGTTSQKIVQMVREAGAAEVHFRSASPPIKHPDFYGIDMPSLDQLMAAQMTLDEMRKTLGVNSLGFLSVDGLYWAMGDYVRDAENPQFTDHAFTGDYPTPLLDYSSDRAAKDIQLSLLAESTAAE